MLQIVLAAAATLLAVLIMYQHRKWTKGEHVPRWMLRLTRLTSKKEKVSEKEQKLTIVSVNCSKVIQVIILLFEANFAFKLITGEAKIPFSCH